MITVVIHFIVAIFMFGLATYASEVLNDICGTVMNCSFGLLNTILGAMWLIIEKIDSHEDKITKETEERSENIC